MNLRDEQSYRNMKDFLLLYNKLTEHCFNHCVANLFQRDLSKDEVDCVSVCANRYVNYNQRLMFNFVEMQTLKNELQAKELEKAALAQQSIPNQGQVQGSSPVTTDLSQMSSDTKGQLGNASHVMPDLDASDKSYKR
ncbi:hypothetical protein CHS0354_019550 [Potamilus streckersoni]|uniref:Mitochondrial import inner membrane translocase subunit n=1 Tax=Potamilus streckersoni TaxID=2493646 RepID=A0AAE0VV33_9BIVA|nr:hypothetical protein CHS0354_019550 [Potamilus streckersoni]